jgi:hypothetical protein
MLCGSAGAVMRDVALTSETANRLLSLAGTLSPNSPDPAQLEPGRTEFAFPAYAPEVRSVAALVSSSVVTDEITYLIDLTKRI